MRGSVPPKIFLFTLLGVALLASSLALTEDEIPPDAFLLPLDADQENTLEMCQDSVDNDNDRHVDCDDQDCEIFAICVEPEPAAPAEQPAPAAPVAEEPPRPEPDPEEPTRVSVPRGYRRADSRGMGILKGVAFGTFFPGLLIGGIAGGVMIANGGDSCSHGDWIGFCASWFAVIGGALVVTGIVTGTIYYTMRNRRQKSQATFALAPIVGDDVMGLGGVFVF